MAQNDQALLMRLNDSGLEFVVIGGVCVVYHGAPLATFDLDICCPFGEENVRRMESAVKDLHPIHRLTANKLPLEMTRSSFGELKNLYLQTDLGKLDCLSEVAGVGDFAAVFKQSVVAKLSYGEFRFLNLDALIAAKKALGRERDLDAVRQLIAIKEKNEQQQNLF
jgi:acyl carrier protein phosphodiesterase